MNCLSDLSVISYHLWFRGRILPCHAGGPGSIPGWYKCLFFIFKILSFFKIWAPEAKKWIFWKNISKIEKGFKNWILNMCHMPPKGEKNYCQHGFEPTTLRLRASWSTDWASQAARDRKGFGVQKDINCWSSHICTEGFIIVFIKLINTAQKKCWKSGSSHGQVVKASD